MIYRIAAILIYGFAYGVCVADTAVDAYRAVLCPPDWRITVAQRYDTRDRFGWIVKRRWVVRCM